MEEPIEVVICHDILAVPCQDTTQYIWAATQTFTIKHLSEKGAESRIGEVALFNEGTNFLAGGAVINRIRSQSSDTDDGDGHSVPAETPTYSNLASEGVGYSSSKKAPESTSNSPSLSEPRFHFPAGVESIDKHGGTPEQLSFLTVSSDHPSNFSASINENPGKFFGGDEISDSDMSDCETREVTDKNASAFRNKNGFNYMKSVIINGIKAVGKQKSLIKNNLTKSLNSSPTGNEHSQISSNSDLSALIASSKLVDNSKTDPITQIEDGDLVEYEIRYIEIPCGICNDHFSTEEAMHHHRIQHFGYLSSSNKKACIMCGILVNEIEKLSEHLFDHYEETQRNNEEDECRAEKDSTASRSDERLNHSQICSYNLSPIILDDENFPMTNHDRLLSPSSASSSHPFNIDLIESNFNKTSTHRRRSTDHELNEKRKHNCGICSMQFSYEHQMHVHRIRHFGYFQFNKSKRKCVFCGELFVKIDEISNHLLKHYPEIARKRSN